MVNRSVKQVSYKAPSARADRFGKKLRESNRRGLAKDRNEIARQAFIEKMKGVHREN